MILELRGLSAYYAAANVIDDVSLSVALGEVTGVIGPNGAGKTSLLRAISGVGVRRDGEIIFQGERIDGLNPDEIVARGLSHCPEGGELFPRMTVKENLVMGRFRRRGRGGLSAALDEMFDLFPVLRTRQKQLAGSLSGGERQMLAIARAMMAKPDLLMLDEPSLGLAPSVVQAVGAMIQTIQAGGSSVLLVEQDVHFALSIATDVYLLENGHVTLAGKREEVVQDDRIQTAYLGA